MNVIVQSHYYVQNTVLRQTQLRYYCTFHAFFLFTDELYRSVYLAVNSEGDVLSCAKATGSRTE